jgi:hypothetical protein
LRHSVDNGLRTSITPSATPLLSEDAVERIHACRGSRHQ